MNIPGTDVEIVPRRILLVEDHESTAEVVGRLLSRHGHEVWKAYSYLQAREIAMQQAVEVLVCDLHLPDGNGFDLLSEIKINKPVKGVVLSGHGSPEDMAHSRQVGFDAHLVKPFDLTEMEQTLSDIFVLDAPSN